MKMRRGKNVLTGNSRNGKKITALTLGIILTLSLCLGGCAGRGSLPVTEEKDAEETSEEGFLSEDGALSDGRGSFVSEVSGLYTCENEAGDTYFISLYGVYGNLYAQCGLVKAGDNSNPVAHPTSGVEIAPVTAGDFYDTTKDKFEVGFMPFASSLAENIYYGAPIKGSLALDGDSLSVELSEGTLCEEWKDETSLTFERNTSVKDPMNMAQSEYDVIPKNHVSEELYGLWSEDNANGSLILDIRKGTDGEPDKMQLYSKETGLDVFVGRGFLGESGDGNVSAKYRGLITDVEENWEFVYSLEDDKVVIKTKLGYTDSYTGEEATLNRTFSKIEQKDIPLIALYEPDDTVALKGNIIVDTEGGERPVTPHFAATDDVENNGGYFVRVGKIIYFRYFTDEAIPDTFTYDCSFLTDIEVENLGAVCWYDPETKESGVAFEDDCSGPIYYANGKFFADQFFANEVESFRSILCQFPDGSGLQYLADGSFDTIEAVWDNKYIVSYNFHAGLISLRDGYFNNTEIKLPDEEYGAHFDVVDGDLLVSGLNTMKGQYVFHLVDEDGSMKELSTFTSLKWMDVGTPIVEQITKEGDDIYVGLGCYNPIGEFLNYMVVKLDSAGGPTQTVAEEAPGKGEQELHHFVMNAMDEILIMYSAGDEVKLSEDRYGDLVWYDSAYSAVRIASGYIKDDPYKTKNGEQAVLLQTAEKLGDNVFVIKADGTYDESLTTDWHKTFRFNGFSFSVIPMSDVANDGQTYNEIPLSIDVPTDTQILSGQGATTAEKAYERILDVYRDAEINGFDFDKGYEEPIGNALADYGWPGNTSVTGYVYYDVNKDGTDELIIMLGDDIMTIYAFDGEKAVLAFNTSYRGFATLYDDGKLQSTFGSMNYASETWLKLNPVLGKFMGEAEMSYTPTSGDPKDVSYFELGGAEEFWEDLNEFYKSTGNIPVYAYEIADEITEQEYAEFASKGNEVTFSEVKPFNE